MVGLPQKSGRAEMHLVDRKYYIALAAWGLGGALWMVLPGATVLNHPSSGTDYFIPLNGAWAFHCNASGSSPLGILFYAPFWLMASIFGMGEPVVRYTHALLFVVVSWASWFCLRERFSPRLTALATAYFSLFVNCLGEFDGWQFVNHDGGLYNFLSIALGQLAILVAWFPGPRRSRDAFIISALLVLEMFVKPNIFVMDLALMMAGVVLLKWDSLRFLLIVAASWMGFTTLVLVVFQVNLPDWFQAVHQAAEARGWRLMNESLYYMGSGNISFGVCGFIADCANKLIHSKLPGIIALGATLMALTACGLKRPNPKMKQWCMLIAALVLVDIVRTEFNSTDLAWPFTMLAAGAILDKSGASKSISILLAILVGLFLAPFLAGEMVAGVRNFAASDRFETPPARIQANPPRRIEGVFANLFITQGDAGDFATRANAGIDLLRVYGLDRKRIGCLDFIDPFPVLLQSPWPDGLPVWLDPGNTFDSSNHLTPEVLFGGTDVLMVPKRVSTPAAIKLLRVVYGQYITNNFEPMARNGSWTLLTRKKAVH